MSVVAHSHLPGSVLCVLFAFIVPVTFGGGSYYLHFMDVETKLASFFNLPTVTGLGSLDFRSANSWVHVLNCYFRAACKWPCRLCRAQLQVSQYTLYTLRVLQECLGRYTHKVNSNALKYHSLLNFYWMVYSEGWEYEEWFPSFLPPSIPSFLPSSLWG